LPKLTQSPFSTYELRKFSIHLILVLLLNILFISCLEYCYCCFSRSTNSIRYKDFDQPPLSEDIASPYSAPSLSSNLETFGVPVLQDPYADFVPKSSDEEHNDATNDSVRAPAQKRRCKEIADIWSAEITRSSQQSQYASNTRYSSEVDVDHTSNYSNRSARRPNRRYNRERDRSVNRNDRNARRQRHRSGNDEDKNNHRFSRYRRDDVPHCGRGSSTSPQRRPNEVLLCDKSSGRTPLHYEDDGVQTDVVEEPSRVVSTHVGRSQHPSIIGDDLLKKYNR